MKIICNVLVTVTLFVVGNMYAMQLVGLGQVKKTMAQAGATQYSNDFLFTTETVEKEDGLAPNGVRYFFMTTKSSTDSYVIFKDNQGNVKGIFLRKNGIYTTVTDAALKKDIFDAAQNATIPYTKFNNPLSVNFQEWSSNIKDLSAQIGGYINTPARMACGWMNRKIGLKFSKANQEFAVTWGARAITIIGAAGLIYAVRALIQSFKQDFEQEDDDNGNELDFVDDLDFIDEADLDMLIEPKNTEIE